MVNLLNLMVAFSSKWSKHWLQFLGGTSLVAGVLPVPPWLIRESLKSEVDVPPSIFDLWPNFLVKRSTFWSNLMPSWMVTNRCQPSTTITVSSVPCRMTVWTPAFEGKLCIRIRIQSMTKFLTVRHTSGGAIAHGIVTLVSNHHRSNEHILSSK